jgi:drug/metabolite transporter (DMT)-like permease
VLTRYAPETVLFHTFWMAALVWAIVTPPWKIIAAGYDLRIWSIFLALALFSTLVPFLLFNRGLRRLRPTEAGVLATLEPLVAVVSAAFFLIERLTPLQNVGALLVVTAAVLSTQRESGAPRGGVTRGGADRRRGSAGPGEILVAVDRAQAVPHLVETTPRSRSATGALRPR